MTSQPQHGPPQETGPAETAEAGRGRRRSGGNRKRRRGPGGLGRGLARILVDAGGAADQPAPPAGLVELVGGQSAVRLASIEATVLDAALRALMQAFGLRALAVAAGAHPDRPDDGPIVRTMTPPGWPDDRGPGLQLRQQLDRLLGRSPEQLAAGTPWREIPLDGHRLWLHGAVEDGRVLAATALRASSLPRASAAALGPAVRALASSMAERGVDLGLRHTIHESTQIALKSEGGDVLAEVNADWPLPRPTKPGLRGRRTGVGRGSEPVQAVARAAAKACRPRCEVLFAGLAPSTSPAIEAAGHPRVSGGAVDGAGPTGRPGQPPGADPAAEIAVVLIRHHRHGLRVGWAERDPGDLGAVAEAVFTAAH